MVRDEESDLRIFAVNVSRNGMAEYDTFGWYSGKTGLIVTVDWEQDGERKFSVNMYYALN